MGIGGSIFLIAVGAIVAFGVEADIPVLNLDVVGWVLMVAGAVLLGLTWWFWNRRRARQVVVRERQVAGTRPPGTEPAPERDTTIEHR